MSLTQKQQAVFEFIRQYFAEHRKSPFIREIQAGCSIASYKSALDRLNALERKGFIKRLPYKHRGIRRIWKASAAPATSTTQPVDSSQPPAAPALEQAWEPFLP